MTHATQRPRGALARVAIAAGAFVVAVAAGPAQAQSADMDARWLAWLGCWQPVEQEATGAVQTVCVVPAAQGSGIELISYAGGAEIARESFSADGARRAVDVGGCAGHETAAWSSDNKRVHVRSELTCEGGNARRATGMIAMASPTEWLDIQAISADAGTAHRGVRVVRYRAVSAEQARMLGAGVPAERAMAVETARHAAAVPVTFEQVLEGIAQLDNEAVEAWLIERQARFPLTASRLVELDDAGVPTSVIDLMVALSNPQRFAIDHSSRSGELRQAERTASGDPFAMRRAGYGRYGGSWFDYGYGFPGYYGYGYADRYGRYGYGSPYRSGAFYGGYTPIIVIVRPGEGDAAPATRPRVVRDRGFTRTPDSGTSAGASSSRGAPAAAPQSSSSGTSTGASSSSGASSSPPARTAQPRQGGGGGQDQ